MLSDAEIKAVEEWFNSEGHITEFQAKHLLATVKEQRKEITEQRELLTKSQNYMAHYFGCDKYHCNCGYIETRKQIEEKVKP